MEKRKSGEEKNGEERMRSMKGKEEQECGKEAVWRW
jgi:hypothetical protein